MLTLTAPLKPHQSRAIAVALLVLAIVLVTCIVVGPVMLLHRHYDSTIESLYDRLARYKRIAAQAPQYKQALDALRGKEGRRFFLKNTAPNLAGAEMQGIIQA